MNEKGSLLVSEVETSGDIIEVRNPANLEIIGKVKQTDEACIDNKIQNAFSAFENWSKTPYEERKKLLLDISDILKNDRERLARILTTEQGKPISEAKHEVTSASRVFRYYAGLDIEKTTVRDDEAENVIITQEPFGVCALVMPWNFPVSLLSWKLAPALLAGNTAIVKPSIYTPLAEKECVELINGILPEGVVDIAFGGVETGRYLVSHPEIDKISFTGSQETGRAIMRSAATNITKVTLELGGNDPAIILPDCNLNKRFNSIFWSVFRNAGQVCIAIKRLYVHESLEGQLIKLFKDKIERLKVGNGLVEATEMGPLNNERQLTRIESLVEGAKDTGAEIVCGGGRYSDETRNRGYFYQPTVITDIDDQAGIVKEEQFGPAIPILGYSNLDEVIERANNTLFGLGGSVWSENLDTAYEIAEKLQCGSVWINTHIQIEHSAPFGGWKQSGIGRELGRPGLEEYMQYKTIYQKNG